MLAIISTLAEWKVLREESLLPSLQPPVMLASSATHLYALFLPQRDRENSCVLTHPSAVIWRDLRHSEAKD